MGSCCSQEAHVQTGSSNGLHSRSMTKEKEQDGAGTNDANDTNDGLSSTGTSTSKNVDNSPDAIEFEKLYKMMTGDSIKVDDHVDYSSNEARGPDIIKQIFHNNDEHPEMVLAQENTTSFIATNALNKDTVKSFLDDNADKYFDYFEKTKVADDDQDEDDDEKMEADSDSSSQPQIDHSVFLTNLKATESQHNFDFDSIAKVHKLLNDSNDMKNMRSYLYKYIEKKYPQVLIPDGKPGSMLPSDEPNEPNESSEVKDNNDNSNGDDNGWIDPLTKKPKRRFHNSTLVNRMKHEELNPSFKYPTDYEELKTLMLEAANGEKNIKAAGTKYCYNDITFCEDVIIDIYKHLWHPNLPEQVETRVKNNLLNERGIEINNSKLLAIAEAGTTVQIVNDTLWPLHGSDDRMDLVDKKNGEKYRCLKYWGGNNQLSLGGLINVGAEGFGGPNPAIGNQVLSLRLLTIGIKEDTGEKYIRELQIEPTNGIHNKTAWDKYYNGSIELIQDDKYFNSVIVSCGTMGIVYSYTIELQNAFNVKSFSFLTSLKKYKKAFNDLVNLQNKGFLSNHKVFFMPYYDSLFENQKDDHDASEKLKVWVRCDYNTTERRKHKTINGSNGGALHGDQTVALLGAAVVVWASKYMPWLLGMLLGEGIKATCYKPIIMDGPTAFSSGVGDAVPVQLTGNVIRLEHFLDGVDTYCTKFRTSFNKKGIWKYRQTSPCAVCFTDYAVGYIGMGSGNIPTAWLETPFPDFETKSKVIGSTYKWQRSMTVLHDTLKVSPYYSKQHLACYPVFFNSDVWKNTEIYPNMDKWLEVYREMNATKLFCNQWTKTYGVDQLAWESV